jgi:hypothetical protein
MTFTSQGAIGILITSSLKPNGRVFNGLGQPFRPGTAAARGKGGGIVAYVPNGSWQEFATGIQVVPIAGRAFSYATIDTPSPVNSCSIDQIDKTAVCVADNNDIYLINARKPGAEPDLILTSGGSGTLSTSSGECTNCGVIVDSRTHTAVIGLALGTGVSGYQLLDLKTDTLGDPIVATGGQTAENFAVDPAQHLILSPVEAISGAPANYQIFDIGNPASPTLFDFANASSVFTNACPGATSDCLDSAAIDSTGIIAATDEFTGNIFLADLSQATFNMSAGTWNAPSQLQNLPELDPSASGFTGGTTAMAVAFGAHEGLLIDEFGSSAFGAIQLPATSGSGTPAVQDWVIASMPNTPDDAAWAMPGDPHGLTAALVKLNGKAEAMGIVMNDQRTFLAIVNIGALLAANRSATESHTIDPTVDLLGTGIVTFIPIHPAA